MAKNICLDCIHFLACSMASQEITECNEYKFVRREVTRIENKNIFDLDIKGFTKEVDNLLDNYTEDELLGELIQNGLETYSLVERKERNVENQRRCRFKKIRKFWTKKNNRR